MQTGMKVSIVLLTYLSESMNAWVLTTRYQETVSRRCMKRHLWRKNWSMFDLRSIINRIKVIGLEAGKEYPWEVNLIFYRSIYLALLVSQMPKGWVIFSLRLILLMDEFYFTWQNVCKINHYLMRQKNPEVVDLLPFSPQNYATTEVGICDPTFQPENRIKEWYKPSLPRIFLTVGMLKVFNLWWLLFSLSDSYFPIEGLYS